jgi:hypothetical protein
MNYRNKRYLENKTLDHITDRLRFLIEVMMDIDEDGKYAMSFPYQKWILERFTHTLEELSLRGMQYPDGMPSDLVLPKLSFFEVNSGIYNSRTHPQKLYKFSSRAWLEKSLRNGEFRLSNALSYRSPNFRTAIQDDELSFSIYPHKDLESYRNISLFTRSVPGGINAYHPTDYYLLCFTVRYSLRMYSDFGADSCLIIHDPDEFWKRILNNFNEQFHRWLCVTSTVDYLDPDDPGNRQFIVPFVKHFKYIYQLEQRFVMQPETPVQRLEPVQLKIGSIEDIAELITIKP